MAKATVAPAHSRLVGGPVAGTAENIRGVISYLASADHKTAPLERAGLLAERVKELSKVLAFKAQGEDSEAEVLCHVVLEAAEEIEAIIDAALLKPAEAAHG